MACVGSRSRGSANPTETVAASNMGRVRASARPGPMISAHRPLHLPLRLQDIDQIIENRVEAQLHFLWVGKRFIGRFSGGKD